MTAEAGFYAFGSEIPEPWFCDSSVSRLYFAVKTTQPQFISLACFLTIQCCDYGLTSTLCKDSSCLNTSKKVCKSLWIQHVNHLHIQKTNVNTSCQYFLFWEIKAQSCKPSIMSSVPLPNCMCEQAQNERLSHRKPLIPFQYHSELLESNSPICQV